MVEGPLIDIADEELLPDVASEVLIPDVVGEVRSPDVVRETADLVLLGGKYVIGRYEYGVPPPAEDVVIVDANVCDVMSANSELVAAYCVRTAACPPASCPTLVIFANSEHASAERPTATHAWLVSQRSRHSSSVGDVAGCRFREAVLSMVAPPNL